MKHTTLVYSSFGFLLSVVFFFAKENKCIFEYILAILISANFVLSILFWSNPIEFSKIYRSDCFVSRLSFVSFSVFILFLKDIDIKLKFIFFLLLALACYFFYNSRKYSRRKWCCKKHIKYHFMFHNIISIGILFAFL
jgi:hypothetical protein